MKAIALIAWLLLIPYAAYLQQAAAVDSLKEGLAEAKTISEKAFWMDNLSRVLMNVDLKESEKVGNDLIQMAEESRDRKVMFDAYMSNGLRCSYFAAQKVYANRSLDYYTTAYNIAKQNKMDEESGMAQLRLSTINLSLADKEKALNHINQAFSIISTLSNDSLRSEAHNVYGNVYLSRNEKILALRHYLNALRLAEQIKNYQLMRHCYIYLSQFYSRIEDYDRAIDYYTLAHNALDKIKTKNVPYERAVDLSSIGNLHAAKKNYDIAISYIKRSIQAADSLKFSSLRVPGYVSLLNQYLRMDPKRALDYMNSSEGMELQKFLRDFGLSSVIDQSYAVIHSEGGNYDSAQHYFIRALPYYEQKTTETNKLSFYGQIASFYKYKGDNKMAVDYYLRVKEIGERLGMLEPVRSAAKNLDTLYRRMGNLQLATAYSDLYHKYKDSIEVLNKEKELAQVEAADEQQRLERMEREELEKKRRRHSIQYMGITIGIIFLFLIMVMMGMFRVSATTIRVLGFFSFLLFFEFLFLIFKKNIYGVTAGEPWKDLAFIIALAAILVPLHHWVEHRVIHFLTSHHMLKLRGYFRRKRQPATKTTFVSSDVSDRQHIGE